MEKFEFSPTGVAALCQQLYQLDDTALDVEASFIAVDFKAWAIAHVAFTESQIVYLDELPLATIQFLAFQTSFAVRHRLPITLIKPEQAGARASKLFKPKAEMELTVLPDDSYTAEGELLLTVF
mgnify:CR=1 FL=1